MYSISIYTGGLYKFDEFKEFIEDLGGLVLKKDSFHLSRGQYFLSEEIHVLTIIPDEDKKITVKKAKEIKGALETPDITSDNLNKILFCLPISGILSECGSWMSKSEIENKIKCPCNAPFCNENVENCFTDYLQEVLDGMVQMEMIDQSEIDGKLMYKLRLEN